VAAPVQAETVEHQTQEAQVCTLLGLELQWDMEEEEAVWEAAHPVQLPPVEVPGQMEQTIQAAEPVALGLAQHKPVVRA